MGWQKADSASAASMSNVNEETEAGCPSSLVGGPCQSVSSVGSGSILRKTSKKCLLMGGAVFPISLRYPSIGAYSQWVEPGLGEKMAASAGLPNECSQGADAMVFVSAMSSMHLSAPRRPPASANRPCPGFYEVPAHSLVLVHETLCLDLKSRAQPQTYDLMASCTRGQASMTGNFWPPAVCGWKLQSQKVRQDVMTEMCPRWRNVIKTPEQQLGNGEERQPYLKKEFRGMTVRMIRKRIRRGMDSTDLRIQCVV